MLHLIEQNEMIKITLRKKVLSVCPSESGGQSWLSSVLFSHHDELRFRKEQNILNLECKCIVLDREFYLREELDKHNVKSRI